MRWSDAWEPLKSTTFRVFWIAALVSNLGTWIHETGAAWLMAELVDSPLMVSLVRTAMTMPIFILSLPAGALADLFDRRIVLMFTQILLLAVAGTMSILTAAGFMTPTLLLALTLAMGLGMVVHVPAWQSIIPELVKRTEVAAAVGLGSLSFNLARAAGPALGGFVFAAWGPWSPFALNAVSFLGVFVALVAWQRKPPPVSERAKSQGLVKAIREGVAFMIGNERTRHVLMRVGLFIVPASCLWGLMPLIAKQRLDLEAAGFGVMLGLFGTGAVLGALVLPVVRDRLGSDRLILGAAVGYAAVYILLATELPHMVRMSAMSLAGLCWMTTLTTLNTTAQVNLPSAFRARGMAMYLMCFSASMAIGSLAWGLVAQRADLVSTLIAAAVIMAIAAVVSMLFPIGDIDAV